MSVVVIPVYNRPDFLHVCLEHITCADNFNEHKYLFAFDYGYDPANVDVIKKFPLTAAIIKTPSKNLSIGKQSHNVLTSLRTACHNSDDIVYYIEDDIMISKDFFTMCADITRNEDVLCTIGSKNHRTDGNESTNENDYYLCENNNNFQSLGVCFSVEKFKKYIFPHIDYRYFHAPKHYVVKQFPNSPLSSDFCEQDGLIRRIIEKEKLSVAFTSVPRCFHAGFYGYHRDVNIDIKKLPLDKKIELIKATIYDIEKVKEISKNKDITSDSLPVNLITKHDYINKQKK